MIILTLYSPPGWCGVARAASARSLWDSGARAGAAAAAPVRVAAKDGTGARAPRARGIDAARGCARSAAQAAARGSSGARDRRTGTTQPVNAILTCAIFRYQFTTGK